MKKKFMALVLGLALTASLIAGCGGKSAGSESAGQMVEGGDFIKGVSTEAPGFDPFTVQTAEARSIFFNIYEGLMGTGTDGSFETALAESYEVSDDLQTYTFVLREGVKFHDGSDLTMEDVLYSIEKAITAPITGYNEIDQYMAGGKAYTVTYKTDKDSQLRILPMHRRMKKHL